MKKRHWLALEFIAVFFVFPALVTLKKIPIPLWPMLWFMCLYCWAALKLDKKFSWSKVHSLEGFNANINYPLHRFGPAMLIAFAGMLMFYPQYLFILPRTSIATWLAVIVLYPILSVYPQTVIYRAFIFERYHSLFPKNWMLIAASGISFGFGHIIFANAIAPILATIVGFFLAQTYQKSKSIPVSVFEHALYGCLIFTVGIGIFFFGGLEYLK